MTDVYIDEKVWSEVEDRRVTQEFPEIDIPEDKLEDFLENAEDHG